LFWPSFTQLEFDPVGPNSSENKGVVPLSGQRLSMLDPLRDRITCLCAQGGLTGHPQVNLPGATVDGLPVGLSIIGPRGSDATLVAVAQAMEEQA
jgi:amidase